LASSFLISNYLALAQANAIIAPNYFNGATLTLYSGIQPISPEVAISNQAPLIHFSLPSPAGTIANNLITFNYIPNAFANQSGFATFFRITNGINVLCDGSVGTSGCDLNLIDNNLIAGNEVSISFFQYLITK
jgi:hypothetical protein